MGYDSDRLFGPSHLKSFKKQPKNLNCANLSLRPCHHVFLLSANVAHSCLKNRADCLSLEKLHQRADPSKKSIYTILLIIVKKSQRADSY